MPAWNHYYHVFGSTYGAWLPGDRRGFSTRHHREHVERTFELMAHHDSKRWREQWSRELMARVPVELSIAARRLACRVIVEALQYYGCDIRAVGVSEVHYHVIARFENDDVRRIVGIAKRRSAKALSDADLADRGGVWAVRCGVKPVKDAEHVANARQYILDHVTQGAAVWPREGEDCDAAGEGRSDAP
jgi:hypothetical protein